MNPEFYEYIMEKLLRAGALDVYFTPIQMKKNRPGIKLNVLTAADNLKQIVNILLTESTSLGVRVIDNIERYCLQRKFKQVETPWGHVSVKLGIKEGEIVNAAPEYDDCKKIAEEKGISLKQVYQYVQGKID